MSSGADGKRYVWVAYAKEPPYLPVAIADSVSELSKKTGLSENNLMSMWCLFRHGKRKVCRVAKVEV